MKAQLKIVTGSLAGSVHVFSQHEVALGRHPECGLKFDAELDIAVSARHAVLLRKADHWYIRDLESRNGTLVNGHPIRTDSRLSDTDQIRLGPDGPLLEFRLVPEGTPDSTAVPAAEGVRASGGPRAKGLRETGRTGISTGERIRVEVAHQTKGLRRVAIGSAALLAVVVGTFAYLTRQQRLAQERELAEIQALTDSVLLATSSLLRDLEGQVSGLEDALTQSQEQIAGFRNRLEEAQEAGNRSEIVALRRQLEGATAALARQQRAAAIDFRGIRDDNQQAVALIYVEFQPGDVSTATAFAVRPDATLMTNRHVVVGPNGNRRPRRLAVQFADSDQVWPARILAISETSDLALIKVDNIVGNVPTIQGFARQPGDLHEGDPVAVIGFPLGADLPMGAGVVSTTLTAGTVSKILPDTLQLDGYGAAGASGSPIFDARGRVVAVLFGGHEASGGRIVFGVPAQAAVRLLESVN